MKFQILTFLLLISLASANCDSSQIDINTASLTELDSLAGVGPATAQNIVDARPYESLDDLNRAVGIGDAKLASIKSQGLACIPSESKTTIVKNEESNQEVKSKEVSATPIQETQIPSESIINLNSEDVILNSVQREQVIFESKNEKVKRNLIFFFAFFLILIILFLLLDK